MSFEKFLSQLSAGTKETIYLSITIGVGIELIQVDTVTKSVKNYTCRPLQYNESLREISDINEFKDAVSDMLSELKLNPKSNVILNLPMVMFGSKELTLMIGDDAVTEALTSEVEQSYIFKRYEPVVSWVDSNITQSGEMRKLFYSAIQKNVIEDMHTALTELGLNLVGIEISLTSLLKALSFSGLTSNQMQDGVSWNLMIINQNGYAICSMVGKNLIDYYEEPLAIKSFEGEEIYNAINASVQITLMSYPASSLCIVSETNLVSAELLANRIQTDCAISFIENNAFKKQDVIPVSLEVLEDYASKISLEAIGIAASPAINLPLRFNFLQSAGSDVLDDPNEPIHVALGTLEFSISPNTFRNISIVISVLFLIPFLILAVIIPMTLNKKQAALDDVKSRIENTQNEIKKLEEEQNKTNDFDINAEIKKVLANNRVKLIAFTALGESVPKNLWITYFTAKDDGKFVIKGESANVEDIYLFYRNMKDFLINTQLRLHDLEMKSESIDDAVTVDLTQSSGYTFEITNMNDAELNPQPQSQPQETPQLEQTEEKSGGNLLNKPLLNFGKNNNQGE